MRYVDNRKGNRGIKRDGLRTGPRLSPLAPLALLSLLACLTVPWAFPGKRTQAPRPSSAAPAASTEDYALILLDPGSPAELAEARDFISQQGGAVAIVLPPRAIMGWVAPDVESKIVGRYGIRAVHRSTIEPDSGGPGGQETAVAINAFNKIVSGKDTARDASDEQREGDPDPRALVNCTPPRPGLNKSDLIRNLHSMGGETGSVQSAIIEEDFFHNSDTMDSSVTVAVFLVESNGHTDPDIYTWTQADQDKAVSQVIEGLNWWVDRSRGFRLDRPLSFTIIPYYASNPVCQQPYEPILHSSFEDSLWVDPIMTSLGGSAGDHVTKVAAFDRRLRDENRTSWSYSIFILYNPPPAETAFTDGRASWAYRGGPATNMLFNSFGWPLYRIVSHESGHIFHACDEYFQPGYGTCWCDCAPEVRPQAYNYNCDDGPCNPGSIPCMMRVNEFDLCQFTVAQIGWTGEPLRAVPTAPVEVAARALSHVQVELFWEDTTTVEDGFKIERRTGSGGDFKQVASVRADSISYSDTDALPETRYSYRLRAFNEKGSSAYSSVAVVVTPPPPPPISIETAALPGASVGAPYRYELQAAGGVPPYFWNRKGKPNRGLPDGISLSQDGILSGTPTAPGVFKLKLEVSDAASGKQTKTFKLRVN